MANRQFDLVYRDTVRAHSPLPCRGLMVRALRVARPWLGVPKGYTIGLGLQIIGPARMRALNRKYRRVDKPTDVLSFPLHQPRIKGYTAVSLGDIFVCPAVVRAKAQQFGKPVRAQMKWTLVHGLLHLAGYDHEKGKKAGVAMARLEQTILKRLG